MIKITVLNDNRCSNKSLECEHGLSLLIEDNNQKVLFDTGQTNIYLKNANKLGIDLNDVESIILSHGDYDHGNGLKYFNQKVNLICHPDFVLTRISKRTGNDNGLNQSREELMNKFDLIETRDPYYIDNGIIFLGEIERSNDFEKDANLPAYDENGNTYIHLDDSGLCIDTPDGLIVISGCAHSGICNTIEYAKKITGKNEVLAVVGGFHLKNIDYQTEKTIEYMKNNNIGIILLAHCTSDLVCEKFKQELPEQTEVIETGRTYEVQNEKNQNDCLFKCRRGEQPRYIHRDRICGVYKISAAAD